LDSISETFWARAIQKSNRGEDSIIHVIRHDKIKFVYCQNGLLGTVTSSIYPFNNVRFLIPETNKIGAKSTISSVPYRIDPNTQPRHDSLGYFYPIELFRQKEKDSNDAYRMTTWSTDYFTSISDEKYKHYIEITERPDYMLIETYNQYLNNITESYFYEWDGKGKLITYSKYGITSPEGFEMSRMGESYSRIRGGWKKKEVGFSTYEDSCKIKVSKNGIFGSEWIIKYFK